MEVFAFYKHNLKRIKKHENWIGFSTMVNSSLNI